MVAGEAEPRNPPARDIAKFDVAASRQDFSERSAARVRRAENAANACARDMRNRNVVLFEDLQYAKVRETARKTAAERNADARTRLPGGTRGTIAADWGLRIHESKDAAGHRLGQWEARPEIEVQKYCGGNSA